VSFINTRAAECKINFKHVPDAKEDKALDSFKSGLSLCRFSQNHNSGLVFLGNLVLENDCSFHHDSYYEDQCTHYTDYCDLYPSDSYYCEARDEYCHRLSPEYYRELAASAAFSIASCVFFLFTFSIGIGILVTYSKFPKYGCSCCETPVVMINGQMVQMQTVATQGSTQHPNQLNGQPNPSFVLTQQPPVSNQPAVVQQTATPVTVAPSSDAGPPPYEFCKTGQT
jgi:hypothetical protein